jgi:hypothetical protein
MDVDKLRVFFAAQKSVRLAYLFGSYAKGKVGPLSDVDVAVLLDRKLIKEERSKMQLELIAEISSLLKTDRVDLVVINDSPIDLNYEIIKHGKIVHVKDPGERVDMESMILSRYLDRRYYVQRGLNTFLGKIIERRGL